MKINTWDDWKQSFNLCGDLSLTLHSGAGFKTSLLQRIIRTMKRKKTTMPDGHLIQKSVCVFNSAYIAHKTNGTIQQISLLAK